MDIEFSDETNTMMKNLIEMKSGPDSDVIAKMKRDGEEQEDAGAKEVRRLIDELRIDPSNFESTSRAVYKLIFNIERLMDPLYDSLVESGRKYNREDLSDFLVKLSKSVMVDLIRSIKLKYQVV
jgi:hypothetical protein